MRVFGAHHDEPNQHFYAIPDFGAGQSMADIHPGMRAMATVEGGKRQKDAAYKAAMAELQERFWTAVGRHFDHTRRSARPRRGWRYQEWKEITAYTKDLANKLARSVRAYERLIGRLSAMNPSLSAALATPQRGRQR